MADELELPGPHTRWHYRFIAWQFGPTFLRLMGGWRVEGREHIPAEGPVLICPNHISYLDPPAIGMACPRRCCYMARASLFDIRGLGRFISKSYAYPVDRDEGGRQAIRIATTLLRAGEVVVLFPEGTRSHTGEMIPGQPGAAFIASRAGAPIVPAALWGTHGVLPIHARGIHRCPVYVRFGPAMHLPAPADGDRLSRAELQAVTDDLMGRIAHLRAEIIAQVPQRWQDRAIELRDMWAARHAARHS